MKHIFKTILLAPVPASLAMTIQTASAAQPAGADHIIGITGAGVTRGRIRTRITTRVQELNSHLSPSGKGEAKPFQTARYVW